MKRKIECIHYLRAVLSLSLREAVVIVDSIALLESNPSITAHDLMLPQSIEVARLQALHREVFPHTQEVRS